MLPKITVCCCTYLRPKYLGHLIHCFLTQTYPNKELIILDDAGQYENQAGDRWKLFSIPGRFATLGQKRNACAALVSPDTQYLAPWDDDDLYFPDALAALCAGLEIADFTIPSEVFQEERPGYFIRRPQWGHHGSWGYRRELFDRWGGYPPITVGEDGDFAGKVRGFGCRISEPLRLGFAPYCIYTRFLPTYATHLFGRAGYGVIGGERVEKTRLVIEPGFAVRGGRIVLL